MSTRGDIRHRLRAGDAPLPRRAARRHGFRTNRCARLKPSRSRARRPPPRMVCAERNPSRIPASRRWPRRSRILCRARRVAQYAQGTRESGAREKSSASRRSAATSTSQSAVAAGCALRQGRRPTSSSISAALPVRPLRAFSRDAAEWRQLIPPLPAEWTPGWQIGHSARVVRAGIAWPAVRSVVAASPSRGLHDRLLHGVRGASCAPNICSSHAVGGGGARFSAADPHGRRRLPGAAQVCESASASSSPASARWSNRRGGSILTTRTSFRGLRCGLKLSDGE